LLLVIVAVAAFARSASADDPVLALEPEGHNGWVSALLLRSDYELVSTSHDHTVRLWNLRTGELMRTYYPPVGRGFKGCINTAALHRDGRIVALAGESALTAPGDERILLLDLDSGEITRTLRGHTRTIWALAYSPDGRWLASGDDAGTIAIWNAESGQRVRVINAHNKRVTALVWSPDGSQLASGSWDYQGKIWSPFDGRQLYTLVGHTGNILSIDWSRDGRTLVSGSIDKSVILWDYSGRQLYAWRNLENHVEFVAFSSDAQLVLYGWGDRKAPPRGTAVLEVATGRERARLSRTQGNPLAGVMTPDGKTAITGISNGEIQFWSTDTGQPERVLRSRGRDVRAVGWSPDGRAIAFGWTTAIGTEIKGTHPLERTFCLSSLDFGPPPDGSFHRALQRLGNYEIERVKNSEVVVRENGATISRYKLEHRDDRIACRSLLTGNRAVIGCHYGLYLFDVRTGRPIYTLPGHTSAVWAVAQSPDGRYLLSGSGDETIEIWNLERYEHCLSLFFAGDEWIAWTPQGYYACSVGGENLMGWLDQHGPERMPTYYPASRFRREHYRPDIIRRVISTGSPILALREANASRSSQQSSNSSSEPITLSASLPPDVTIAASADGKNLAEGDASVAAGTRVTISATATPRGKDGIESLELLVDGRPWETHRRDVNGRGSDSAVNDSWTIELPAGEHAITVRADTARAHQFSGPLSLSGKSDVPVTSTLYVLTIGVSHYADPALAMPHASPDAKMLAEKLAQQGHGTYGRVVTRTLTDAQATKPAIAEALTNVQREMGPNDVAVIYFAGQAARDANGDVLLLSSQATAAMPSEAVGVSGDSLRKTLRATRGQVLVWLELDQASASQASRQAQVTHDYCLGDMVSDDEVADSQSAVEELLRSLSSDDLGVQVLSAAGSRETPRGNPQRRGFFAQAIGEALSPLADSDHDGVVTVRELEAYVHERVGVLADNQQHPVAGHAAAAKNVSLGNVGNAP
jgi:WD40 repeat protein